MQWRELIPKVFAAFQKAQVEKWWPSVGLTSSIDVVADKTQPRI
jgi:hypothetical protein